jgi:adenylate kinase
MKLTDKEKSSCTRVIVMGLSGSGKSTLVAQLARDYHLHWITLDNDLDILKKLPDSYKENVDVYDIPDTASSPRAADTMLKLFKNKKGSICDKHGLWECAICKKESLPVSSIDLSILDPHKDIVVVDTITSLAHSIMAHAVKGQSVDYKPERDDWGALRRWSEFFYSEFQGAKFNLICIAHTVEAQMEDDRVKLVPAFGSKDMSSKIAGAFSHVVYCDMKNKEHKAYSGSTYANNILTKSRTDFLIENLKEPSLLPIFTGVVPETLKVEAKAVSNTPAHSAVSALEKLKEKLNAK